MPEVTSPVLQWAKKMLENNDGNWKIKREGGVCVYGEVRNGLRFCWLCRRSVRNRDIEGNWAESVTAAGGFRVDGRFVNGSKCSC